MAKFLAGHLSPSRRLLSNTPKSTAFVISETHQLQWLNFWSATCLQVADCCRTRRKVRLSQFRKHISCSGHISGRPLVSKSPTAVEHAEKYGFRNFGSTSAAVAKFLVGHLSPSRRLLSNTSPTPQKNRKKKKLETKSGKKNRKKKRKKAKKERKTEKKPV